MLTARRGRRRVSEATATIAACGRGRTVPIEQRVSVRWADGSEPVVASQPKTVKVPV